MTDKKTLDATTRSAFEAGVALGAGYPAREAIPEGVPENAYRAWRERWTGRPHEPQERPCSKVVAAQEGERCPYYRDRQHRAECYMPGRGHMARTGMEVGG